MSRPVISVENLSKAYRIGLKEEIPDTLAGAFTGFLKSPFRNLRQLSRLDTFRHQADDEDIFWALKDVSFEVQEGEVLGVIGRNGAGKSTLLKILSRITEPTSGRAVIRGRVSSLLEVGTGFHPELSGRENVYLNGTILGMTKAEIDRKFDEIVDFSGVEKFLDTPIKRYSSGMKVRLAFAVAAHLEPEILIIDEVLAVGDAEFQKKCLGKMQDVASHGRTVLFVSHNMAAVRTLCSSCILLNRGTMRASGDATDVLTFYLHSEHQRAQSSSLATRQDRTGNGFARITDLHFRGSSDSISSQICSGESATITVCFQTLTHETQVSRVAVSCFTLDGTKVFHIDTSQAPHERQVQSYFKQVSFSIKHLPLVPGQYRLDALINTGLDVADHIESAALLDVDEADFYSAGRATSAGGGLVFITHSITPYEPKAHCPQ